MNTAYSRRYGESKIIKDENSVFKESNWVERVTQNV